MFDDTRTVKAESGGREAVQPPRGPGLLGHEDLYDQDTGLPSPALLRHCWTRLAAPTGSAPATLSLLLVEIDGFGALCRFLGPSLSGIMLGVITRRLVRLLNAGETVEAGRFIVLLGKHDTPDQVEALADRIRETLSRIRTGGPSDETLNARLGFVTVTDPALDGFDAAIALAERALEPSRDSAASGFGDCLSA